MTADILPYITSPTAAIPAIDFVDEPLGPGPAYSGSVVTNGAHYWLNPAPSSQSTISAWADGSPLVVIPWGSDPEPDEIAVDFATGRIQIHPSLGAALTLSISYEGRGTPLNSSLFHSLQYRANAGLLAPGNVPTTLFTRQILTPVNANYTLLQSQSGATILYRGGGGGNLFMPALDNGTIFRIVNLGAVLFLQSIPTNMPGNYTTTSRASCTIERIDGAWVAHSYLGTWDAI